VRLLVSVATAAEAAAAVAGGADIVDAKDPRRGALGAVSLHVFASIHAAVGGMTPVSAAAGDAGDEARIVDAARAFSQAGAAFVKVGFAGIRSGARVAQLLRAALVRTPAVIAVAYADSPAAGSIPPEGIIEAAARAGALGVLIDTADKQGPGLCGLVSHEQIHDWVGTAHEHGMIAAVAGKLTARDIEPIARTGADIAGVRGAACDHGRMGTVSSRRVRTLRDQASSCSAVI